nr:RNA-directed DNA polymerase, eukaryota [Tanacetum cinerariifolium]
MSIYKVPKGVLHRLEMIRNRFFIGADDAEKRITWIAWDKVLASKKHGGLFVMVWKVNRGTTYSPSSAVMLSPLQDRWVCNLNGDGCFRVKDFRTAIDDCFLPSSDESTRWLKYVPKKINIFAWRARHQRLPTRDNLAKRGVQIDSNSCPVCGDYPEDVQHLLFGCNLAKSIFHKICRWWNLDWVDVSSFGE